MPALYPREFVKFSIYFAGLCMSGVSLLTSTLSPPKKPQKNVTFLSGHVVLASPGLRLARRFGATKADHPVVAAQANSFWGLK